MLPVAFVPNNATAAFAVSLTLRTKIFVDLSSAGVNDSLPSLLSARCFHLTVDQYVSLWSNPLAALLP